MNDASSSQISNREQEAEARGAQEMLRRVRASLESYPAGGGDEVVMRAVEQILASFRKDTERLDKLQKEFERQAKVWKRAYLILSCLGRGYQILSVREAIDSWPEKE